VVYRSSKQIEVRADDGARQAPGVAPSCLATIAGATAIFLVLSWQGECWAYIDPNAGGFLWQIVAPLASIFLSFLFYCRKEIRRLVKSIRNRWKGSEPSGAAHEVRK
jgi:hypothetical protein